MTLITGLTVVIVLIAFATTIYIAYMVGYTMGYSKSNEVAEKNRKNGIEEIFTDNIF